MQSALNADDVAEIQALTNYICNGGVDGCFVGIAFAPC